MCLEITSRPCINIRHVIQETHYSVLSVKFNTLVFAHTAWKVSEANSVRLQNNVRVLSLVHVVNKLFFQLTLLDTGKTGNVCRLNETSTN